MKRIFSFVNIMLILTFCILSWNLAALAKDSNDLEDKRRGERRGPPQEAIDSCNQIKEGGPCTFETLHGKLTGECKTMREEKVCVPEGEDGQSRGNGPSGKGAPPQEAVDACSGKLEKDSCKINTPRGLLTGACRSIEDQLACVPKGASKKRRGESRESSSGRPRR